MRLTEWLNQDSRGPTNDPAWRERHPESTVPPRKPGTVLCVADHACTRGFYGGMNGTDAWTLLPELYTFPKPTKVTTERIPGTGSGFNVKADGTVTVWSEADENDPGLD